MAKFLDVNHDTTNAYKTIRTKYLNVTLLQLEMSWYDSDVVLSHYQPMMRLRCLTKSFSGCPLVSMSATCSVVEIAQILICLESTYLRKW
jgi:hypothetical protein